MVALTDSHKSRPGLIGSLLAFLAGPKPAQPVVAHLPPPAQPVCPKMPSVDAVDRLTVLMLGHAEGALSRPGRWLGDLGARVQWLEPQARALSDLARAARPGATHLLIDLDAFGGIVFILEALRQLRDARPDLPVILVSEELSVDDFSLERLALCDASLRAPMAFSSLEYALTETREINNPAWVARLKDLADGPGENALGGVT